MEKPNAATPGSTPATPANVEPVKTQPSSSPAAASNNGATGNQEGKVTITTKEYAQLQRAQARTLSFEKRAALARPTLTRETNADGATPEQQALADEQARADAAERRALQLEVGNSVRDLLAKPEFANLPASTKALVLKNPQMLSDADNLEEALLDIEDALLEIASEGGDNIPVVVKDGNGATRPSATSNHETPPTSAGGAAIPEGGVMEDTSKLTGSARSRAILRNSIKVSKTGAQK